MIYVVKKDGTDGCYNWLLKPERNTQNKRQDNE
jgi:hypothetical protein